MNPRQDAQRCLCGVLLARDNTDGQCTSCTVKSRDRLATAPEVSAEFWEEPTMREALDDCHMGHVIRAFRLHPHHGRRTLSQEMAARWGGVTQAQLSRIESGAPMGHIDRLAQWAEILHIPSLYLWFRVPGQRGEHVKRSEFLRMGGLAVAGASASMLLGGATVTSLTEEDCAQWLAWELWKSRRSSINDSELPVEIAAFLRSYTVGSTGRLVLRDSEGSYSFAHPSFVDFYVAQRIFRNVVQGDSSLFAAAQTSHETDLVIREFVLRDQGSAASLGQWMMRAPSPVLRVNSAGVLAKLGLSDFSDKVVTSLKRDGDTRQLYLTAVTSRVLGVSWEQAGGLAASVQRGPGALIDSLGTGEVARYLDRLTTEIHNPRDAAARWCAVVLLDQFQSVAPDQSAQVLHGALRFEQSAETLRSIGAVLAGDNPISF